jgi:hypothetical protein
MKKSFLKNIIKESITDYLSELNSVNEEETTEKIVEEPHMAAPALTLENNFAKEGKIYLVKKAMNESTDSDMVEEKSLVELIGEGYVGAYNSKEKAISHAKKALKDRDLVMKENVKKGNSKLSELMSQIEDLKADIKAKQSKAIDEPGMRDSLVADVDGLMTKLNTKEAALEKLKAALEKSSPKKEKKEKKDDE